MAAKKIENSKPPVSKPVRKLSPFRPRFNRVSSAKPATPSASDPPPEPVATRDREPYGPDSAIKLYLREVGRVALLTVPEENQLAARIKRGDKAAREHMIKAN